MGCGTSFVKYVLFFFNLVVALLGLALIGIGVAFHLNWSPLKDELKSHITVAPWLFIILGAVMFVIAFFGCCGAIRESHCMVVTYAIFLLVIIIVQVIVGVLLFVYGDTIKTTISNSIDTLFDKGNGVNADKVSREVFETLEKQFECCGKSGSGDYYLSAKLPSSCCVNNKGLAIGDQCIADPSTPGCSTRIVRLYEKWSKPIAGIAIGVACIEVVGALFSLCLANSIRNMDRRSHY